MTQPDDPTTEATGDNAQPEMHPHEVFDVVGGMPAFEALVASFYARVAQDEVLRPMYPEDLEPGARHLAMFFAQYWGGGEVYSRERGHPRLRMRHAAFPITEDAARRWASHMMAAIEEQGFPPAAEALLQRYVQQATPTLINQFPHQAPGPGGSSLPQV
ncbi:MAG: globin [Nitriliruptoraceae bacterium]